MYKLICVIIIILLTGCNKINETNVNNTLLSDIVNIGVPYKDNIDVYKFNYKNHQYLYFTPYSQLQHGSIVHDPDCPCLKQ